MHETRIYIGIGGSVMALDAATGQEIWRQKISSGATYTTVSVVGEHLFATSSGEIWCLEPEQGRIVWHNRLKGLGVGYVSIAGREDAPVGAADEDHAAVRVPALYE